MFIRTREHFWVQRENGILDEETYLSYRNTLSRMLLLSDFYRKNWDRRKNRGEHVPGFVEEIDTIIAGFNLDKSSTKM